MLRISKLTDYAILVMVELNQAGSRVTSAQALAERCHLELPTVSKVLKMLARAKLVRSYRGAAGGYRVNGAPSGISVADIIAAIEGPIAMTECSVHEGLCTVESSCNARENWQKISLAVAAALERVSLAEMAGAADTGPAPGRIPGLHIATVNT